MDSYMAEKDVFMAASEDVFMAASDRLSGCARPHGSKVVGCRQVLMIYK